MSETRPPERVAARGRIIELVELPQPDGRVFEMARRAPGVRLIIADLPAHKLLLTREFRRELDDYDYRLPGGKVFDTLDEYADYRADDKDLQQAAAKKAVAEAREEAGMSVDGVSFVAKSTLGTTMEWDLYIFAATNFSKHADGQALEAGEQIDEVGWYDFAKVEQMILGGQMQEERVALALLRWLKREHAGLQPGGNLSNGKPLGSN